MNKFKLVKSSAYAAVLTIVFVTVLTIWAELSLPIKDGLKSISGHHWTTKSIFSVLFFIVIFLKLNYFSKTASAEDVRESLYALITFTIVGIFALTLFFAGHHFHIF